MESDGSDCCESDGSDCCDVDSDINYNIGLDSDEDVENLGVNEITTLDDVCNILHSQDNN